MKGNFLKYNIICGIRENIKNNYVSKINYYFFFSLLVVIEFGILCCNNNRPLKDMPKCPLAALKKFGNKGAKEELVERENWARNQLMAAGSDLLGKFSNLQVLSLLILICFATST